MAIDFLTGINLSKNELQNAVVQNLASAPSPAVKGQIYFNTTDNHLYYCSASGAPGTWVQADGLGAAMTGENIVTAINGSTSVIDLDNLPAGVGTAVSNSHTHANMVALGNVSGTNTGDETATSVGTILNGLTGKTTPVDADTIPLNDSQATGALKKLTWSNLKTALATHFNTLYNNYSHPNHTGDVTSTGDGATVIGANKVTNGMLAQVATGTIKGRLTASTGNVEDLTAANVRSIINVADGANNYSHPTGDGNLHVPVTSTTNSGNILIAGASAGTFAWGTNAPTWANVSGKPSSAVADIEDAVSKRHTQHTDTGTTSQAFQLQSGSSGVKLKNNSGVFEVRNAADNAYANIRVNDLIVDGTTTTINSNEVNIGDAQILLNADITTSAANSDGGIAVKRLMADNTTRKDAVLNYNTSTNRWDSTFGVVTGTLVTAQLTNKVVANVGTGAATTIDVVHNFNTRDCSVTLRQAASPYAQVMTDIEYKDLNTVTLKFAVAPTSNQYVCTIIG